MQTVRWGRVRPNLCGLSCVQRLHRMYVRKWNLRVPADGERALLRTHAQQRTLSALQHGLHVAHVGVSYSTLRPRVPLA